jgi:two-component system nitrogen regulation response regulator NtrX
VAARCIHRLSKRADKPFMVVNCATLRPERLEIELFGSVDGVMDEPGKSGILEQANGGTLLLDEVSDMSLETQGKMIRVLQDRHFQRVGSDKSVEVDVRILASTNRDLEQAIKAGTFREDFYYRLNVVPVHMPPLRQRLQDVPLLVEYFSKSISRNSGLPALNFSEGALAVMQAYNWPGNIRQLRNSIEWVLIMNAHKSGEVVDVDSLPPEVRPLKGASHGMASQSNAASAFVDLPLREAREEFERDYLQSQVNRFGGNISKTAQFIEMERSALHRKLKALNIVGHDKDGIIEEGADIKRQRA